jgi:alanyl-tRNA synthetase
VIADHLRAMSFLVADGVLPSNEGRGYVLRRIMRRAMRHAHLLGASDPVLHKLVPTLVREMGDAYPELVRARALITETIELEETRFRKLLERGLGLLDEATAPLQAGDVLDGTVAFKLYDTYGFPLDLTQDALRSRGMSVDETGFDTAMKRQKEGSKAAGFTSGDAASGEVWFRVRDAAGATEFLGYSSLKSDGQVKAIIADGAPVDTLAAGQQAELVLDRTPFYAESGGQAGDQGVITFESGEFQVRDVQKRAGELHVHIGELVTGTLKNG